MYSIIVRDFLFDDICVGVEDIWTHPQNGNDPRLLRCVQTKDKFCKEQGKRKCYQVCVSLCLNTLRIYKHPSFFNALAVSRIALEKESLAETDWEEQIVKLVQLMASVESQKVAILSEQLAVYVKAQMDYFESTESIVQSSLPPTTGDPEDQMGV